MNGEYRRVTRWVLFFAVIVAAVAFLVALIGCGPARAAVHKILGTTSVVSPHTGPVTPPTAQQEVGKSVLWMVPWLILGSGGAIVLIFLKQIKLGIALGAGCVVSLILALTVFKHLAIVTWGAVAVGALVAGYGLYRVWINRRAISELVMTAELAKEDMTEDAQTRVFGDEGSGEAGEIQSKATEKLVAVERKRNGD